MRRTAEERWDPEIVYVEDPEWPGAGTYSGVQAVLRRFNEVREVLGDAETEVEEVLELSEGRVLVVWRYTSVAAGSGIPLDQQWAYIATLRDGLLVRLQAVMDIAAVKRDEGL